MATTTTQQQHNTTTATITTTTQHNNNNSNNNNNNNNNNYNNDNNLWCKKQLPNPFRGPLPLEMLVEQSQRMHRTQGTQSVQRNVCVPPWIWKRPVHGIGGRK